MSLDGAKIAVLNVFGDHPSGLSNFLNSPALTRFSKQVPPTIAQSAEAFFGVQYQAMGGSLDRDDLSARVGGERKLGATDGGSYALKHSRHVL